MKHTRRHARVVVVEVPHAHDLHAFEVRDRTRTLGTIIPASVEDADAVRVALADGACPICEGWEDGMGHTVTISTPWH